MQVIYGANTASNILFTAQKRLVRPLYAQTQGFPYAASLDPSLRNTDGTIRIPSSSDSQGQPAGASVAPFSRSAAAFTQPLNGSLIPGLVVVKTAGEQVAIAPGSAGTPATSAQPMGLLGQWVGGPFDNVGTSNQVGIWMGPDSVYELLAPAWNDTGLATAVSTFNSNPGTPVLLYAGTDGRLVYLPAGSGAGAAGTSVPVARVIDRPSPARLVIQMLV